jgi:ATP-dependent DNA helicase
MYHGTPEERSELRRTVMRLPVQKSVKPAKKPGANSGRRKAVKTNVREAPPKKQAKRKAVPPSGRRSKTKREDQDYQEDEDQDDQSYVESVDHEHDVVMNTLPESSEDDAAAASFPVVITTYEMIIKDRVHLSAYDFSYIGLFPPFLLGRYPDRSSHQW